MSSKLNKYKEMLFSGNKDEDAAKAAVDYISLHGTAGDKELLIGLLGESGQRIIEFTQESIVRLNDKELIQKLFDIAVSDSSSIKIRSNSFDTLKQIAMKNGNFLIDYFDKNDAKYNRVISELVRYGNFIPKDYPKKVLILLSKSSDEITRANAIESIGLLRFKLGSLLIKALDDTFFVSSSAIFAIGQIRLKRAFPRLKELFVESGETVIRNMIIDSLPKIGGEDVTDFLLYLLGSGNKYKVDKIYALKSLYSLCMVNSCKKGGNKAKNSLLQKVSNLNLRIPIYSIAKYEEKEVIDSILCYFSYLNHKKSEKVFKFILDFYLENENIDNTEYNYIKFIIKKVARPKYIVDYIKSLKVTSDFHKTELLVAVLFKISPRDITNLLYFFKNKKLFVDIKILLLLYGCSIFSDKNFNYKNDLEAVVVYHLKDLNGNVRKSAINLLGCSKNGIYIEKLFGFLVKESLPDVIDAFITGISNLLSYKRNKKYFNFLLNNLSLKDDKVLIYSLKIIGEARLSLNDDEISELYGRFANFKNVKSVDLKRLLANILRKLDLAKYKDRISFLFEEKDEEVKINYLESLFISGFRDLGFYLNVLSSGKFSDKFKYKMVELIEKFNNTGSFDSLAEMLDKEKSKIVKIAILRGLNNIDSQKASGIIKKYSSSKDKDIKNYSIELMKQTAS